MVETKSILRIVILALVVVVLLLSYTYIFNQKITLSVVLVAVLGFALACVDTSIGMGFGTLGSPILLILGYSSKLAVPSVLISQCISAFLGMMLHQKYKNVNILKFDGMDAKIGLRLVAFGVVGVIIATFLALKLPAIYLNSYIGLLVIAMGIILLAKRKLAFSWAKINLISFVSGFNKAISGGGYGPVATTGLVVSGHPLKNSIGITLLSVAVINLTAFGIYLASQSITNVTLPIFLTIGAIIGSQFGPKVTKHMDRSWITKIFAAVVIILGILTLAITVFNW